VEVWLFVYVSRGHLCDNTAFLSGSVYAEWNGEVVGKCSWSVHCGSVTARAAITTSFSGVIYCRPVRRGGRPLDRQIWRTQRRTVVVSAGSDAHKLMAQISCQRRPQPADRFILDARWRSTHSTRTDFRFRYGEPDRCV